MTIRMPRPPPPAIALMMMPALRCLAKKAFACHVDRAIGAGQDRRLVLPGVRAGAGLVAEQIELLGRGADEDDPRLGAGFREGGVLGEEAVARMHGVAAGLPRGRDHTGDIEIGGSPASLERPHLVDPADMQRGRVVFRMDAHRGDAEFGGGLGDADGDLAAIGDQEFLEHVGVG